MTATVPMWVNGAADLPSGAQQGNIHNPAAGKVIRTVVYGSAQDVDRAVNAARAAFPAWRDTPAVQRARIVNRFRELLQKNHESLARLISEEHGKSVVEAMGSIQRGLEVVEFAAGAPHLLKGSFSENVSRNIDSYSIFQPLGVCVGITPFNFPAMVPLWMFPVALVCGNTFVLKPSEKVPSASMRMAELLKESGLPDGAFNIVHGDGVAVDALITHPRVQAVSFVGSTGVARRIYETAATHGKRVQALGGAKNHAVVLPDADIEAAATALMGAAFSSAGQRCMAISAVVAVAEAGDAIVEALKCRVRQSTSADVGPLITAAQRDRVVSAIDEGVRQGATLAIDGRNATNHGFHDNFFVGPTIFDHVRPEMNIYRNEIFGPVLVVLRADSLDDAVALVNCNPYGNGSAIFTRSGHSARRFQNEIEAGMVGINVAIPISMAFYSFGGWKHSLFGDLAMHGMEGIYFYTRRKTITTRWE